MSERRQRRDLVQPVRVWMWCSSREWRRLLSCGRVVFCSLAVAARTLWLANQVAAKW